MPERNNQHPDNLVDYYNKFSEEKRLDSRHGQVEYRISMQYIHEYLKAAQAEKKAGRYIDGRTAKSMETGAETGSVKVLDIGAGTGRYAVALADEGYDVTAVELVKYNLGMLKRKKSTVKAYQGDARNLKMLADNTYDVTLLFGPLYHLFTREDKLAALLEAKRVTRPGGVILAAYVMNEYSVVTYAFKECHVTECQTEGRFTADFHTVSRPENLYDYVRIEDIRELSEAAGLTRLKMISPDGPANYIRSFLNRLSEEEFEQFVAYQTAVCERQDLLGAGAHTVDILKKPE